MSKEEREKYDESIKVYRDYLATLAYIEQSEERGMKRGMEEGERNKQLAIARNMKMRNMPIDIISEVTGLSDDEVKKL